RNPLICKFLCILFASVLLSASVLEPALLWVRWNLSGLLIPLTHEWFFWQDKYPDVVILPEGCRSELMIIRSPQLPGISLTIFWKIDVSKEGVVKPAFELLLKMPDQARELDTKKVMENGSDNFQSLLRILGVEASIEALIRTVCL
ncbi:hypothetical protein PO909_027440, partial [Leuciscus waleckii]